jgi:diamine N-acetyltransferase
MIFHQNLDHIFTPREGATIGFEENQVRRLMKSEDGLVLMAVDNGKVVGYSLSEIHMANPGFHREKYGYIDDAAVTASHRRRGIGRIMLVEIMNWFRSKKIRRAELSTASQNITANSFWRKQGFEVYMHTLYKEI